MYSTCIFCHASLGANEVLEQFPVGRRVAFDPAKGRLWAVCPHCARWNLSPIEERWEVQEECERRFRGTRLRFSTEQIGMARLSEGLELVRIGDPLRPELAAWRYGDIFGRRMRKQIAYGVGSVALAATYFALPGVGLALGALGVGGGMLINGSALYLSAVRPALRVPVGDGAPVGMTTHQIVRARLNRVKWDWEMEIDCRVGFGRLHPGRSMTLTLRDDNAIRAAAVILSRLNRGVGRRKTVNTAVDLLEEAGNADACFRAASRVENSWWKGKQGTFVSLPAPIRLAMEMSGHEEAERAALEGELRTLELAWQEAEEIAAIADTLALPEGIEEKLTSYRSPPPDPQ